MSVVGGDGDEDTIRNARRAALDGIACGAARWQCVGTARCLVGLTICHTSRRATWTRTPAAFRSSVSDCAAAHEHAHARAARLERRQGRGVDRSEEHTSELQSLMRISYAVFCLKTKHTQTKTHTNHSKYDNRK